jgi:hypothetical protein
MSFSYRITPSTVYSIIIPTCEAIWNKHFETQTPHNSGSLFFNYRKTFSVVLLALVDANYKLTIIPVGGYGISSDGGLLLMSLHQNNKLFLVYDKCCLVSLGFTLATCI